MCIYIYTQTHTYVYVYTNMYMYLFIYIYRTGRLSHEKTVSGPLHCSMPS